MGKTRTKGILKKWIGRLTDQSGMIDARHQNASRSKVRCKFVNWYMQGIWMNIVFKISQNKIGKFNRNKTSQNRRGKMVSKFWVSSLCQYCLCQKYCEVQVEELKSESMCLTSSSQPLCGTYRWGSWCQEVLFYYASAKFTPNL